MNKIYQQKMERYSEEYVFENCEREREVPLVKDAYQNGWHNALQNQWISVEEALPERGSLVFIRLDHGGYSVRLFTNYDKSFIDTKGGKVTHWMPIPPLKGGEE